VWCLEFKLPGRQLLIPLEEGASPLCAGSAPGCNIHLPFKGVSRKHFSLHLKDSRWQLKDEGSTNGTFVNEKKVDSKTLRPGDVITAGAVRLAVRDKQTDSGEIVSFEPYLMEEPRCKTTDTLPYVPLEKQGECFYFPNLTFPKGMVLGRSVRIMEVYQRLDGIGLSDAPVLLVGETGTGKEMLARIIHLSGKRSKGPFVPVNCAAIPDNLAEAELFGVGKRVATEVDERPGKLMLASGGTLFLDEVETITLPLQTKLLRVIEDRTVYPLGASKALHADFRLVAATNAAPEVLMKEGKLRPDFFHRISTLELAVPPLRERKEDGEPLLLAFFEDICKQEKRPLKGITREALRLLCEYPYPGNIREMLNIIRSIVVLALPGETLNEQHIPARVLQSNAASALNRVVPDPLDGGAMDYHEMMDRTSVAMINHALVQSKGNVSKAAKLLKLSENGLAKAMKRLGIKAKKS
jgi:DNA-binding NtrC family response regulator